MELDAAIAELAAASDTIQTLQTQLDAQPTEAPATAAPAATTELDSLKAQLASAEGAVLPEIDLPAIKADVDAIVNGNMTDSEKAAALEAIQAKLDEADSALTTSASQYEAQKQLLADANGALDQLGAQLATAQTDLNALQGKLESGNAQIATLEAQISALETQGDPNGTLEALRAQVTDAQTRSAEMEA